MKNQFIVNLINQIKSIEFYIKSHECKCVKTVKAKISNSKMFFESGEEELFSFLNIKGNNFDWIDDIAIKV